MEKNFKLYHVMFQDMCVADVISNNNNMVQQIIKYIPDSYKQPFWGDLEDKSSQYLTNRFYNFLKDRCYEDGRKDLPVILEQAGLSSNNPYEWVKVCHGVTWEDFFWIKFENEDISWNDVRVR